VAKVTSDKSLPDEVLSQIVAKTDGVPLFVEELTKTVLEAGFLKDSGDRYELDGPLPPLAIPSTLQGFLVARLDRLSQVKEVAQIGACIGRVFAYDLLAAVAPLGDNELQDAVKELVNSELVFRRGAPPDATYAFKHALVQDAAYESLLKSRRQHLHGRIATVLEEQFPDAVENQPELLAHHYTEAGLIQLAIGHWLEAGKRASARSANIEAIAQLRKGLRLVLGQPESQDRDRQELDLQVALGPPFFATKGYAASEVGEIYTRALELCRRHGNPPQIFQVLYGMSAHQMIGGQHIRARNTGEEFVSEAETKRDLAARVVSHRVFGTVLFFTGEFARARREIGRTLELYDDQNHKTLSDQYGHDPRAWALSYLSATLWVLGYSHQALRKMGEGIAQAEKLAHPHSLAAVNFHSSRLHLFRREPRESLLSANAVQSIGTEQGDPEWVAFSKILRGWARAEQGEIAGGIEEASEGLDWCRSGGTIVNMPGFLGAFAEALEHAGRPDEALRAISEGLEIAEETEERWYDAELHRLKGNLSRRGPKPDEASAIDDYRRAIEIAQSQDAKSWELRAATSLARLWQAQGKTAEARDLLSPVYGWFTEGFDTADLKDAKALLDELA